MSKIEDFGPSNEVCEIATEFSDKKISVRFLKKAILKGVRFTTEEILELTDYVEENFIPELVQYGSVPYTEESLEDISAYIPEEDTILLAKKYGIDYGENFEEEEYEEEHEETERGIIGGLFAMLGINKLLSKKQNYDGKCTGDCENCPSHYGYRYGRWYYGHHHSHGCEFGGNN